MFLGWFDLPSRQQQQQLGCLCVKCSEVSERHMSALEVFVTDAGAIRRLRVDAVDGLMVLLGFFFYVTSHHQLVSVLKHFAQRQKKPPTESGIVFLHLTCVWRDLNHCKDQKRLPVTGAIPKHLASMIWRQLMKKKNPLICRKVDMIEVVCVFFHLWHREHWSAVSTVCIMITAFLHCLQTTCNTADVSWRARTITTRPVESSSWGRLSILFPGLSTSRRDVAT